MSVFVHEEDVSGLHPRHPLVCILDVVGFVVVAVLVVMRLSHLTAAVLLPLAIALQYVASCLHHWLPYSEVRSKLDRSVIFLVIAATYVPYWGRLLPAGEALHRLPWVGAAAVAGIALLLLEVPSVCLGIYWMVFASAGLFISFHELQQWLPSGALAAFWISSACYGLQQLVFALRWPNPAPELFGYREVQHVFLLGATTIGSIVALHYT